MSYFYAGPGSLHQYDRLLPFILIQGFSLKTVIFGVLVLIVAGKMRV